MIRINDIHINYEADGEIQTSALRGVSIDINDGDFVAIVGPSGSGKSSLLSGIAGLVPVVSGDIFVDKFRMSRVARYKKAWVRANYFGIIFQFSELINRFTIEENIRISWFASGKGRSKEELDYTYRLEYLVETLDLHSILHKMPGKLSGGELQKAAIARAFIRDNPIILADEPSGDLDPENVKRLKTLLRKENTNGKTIIMVTHDQNLANEAKTIYHLADGRITEIKERD